MGHLSLRLWGLTLSQMNDASTLGLTSPQEEARRNTVSVSAGSDGAGMGEVFEGTIKAGWADFQAMPQSVFHVEAFAGMLAAMKPVPPASYRGAADVATIMAGLATKMGFAFENSGVNVKLADPYFPGTAWEQFQRCKDAANINGIIEKGKLAIWPKGQARGSLIPLIAGGGRDAAGVAIPNTGMIGYPTYTSGGIVVTTLYNPSIGYGSKIEVKSSLKPACGIWFVSGLTHMLESETPGGNWFTRIEATQPGFATIH